MHMNIYGIFFNNGIRTGGHRRYLRLLEGLAAKNCPVTLFYNRDLALDLAGVKQIPVNVPYVYHKTKALGQKFACALQKFLRTSDYSFSRNIAENGFVLIHGETHWAAAKVLSRTCGLPIAFAQRSDSFTESRMYLRYEILPFRSRLFHLAYMFRQFLREQEIARKAGILFFQSETDRDSFLRRTGRRAKEKTAVVRGDIRQENFNPEYAMSNTSVECRKLLFLGTLGARKGVRYLLQACARLHEAGLPFTLRVFGSGSGKNRAEAAAFLEKHGLSSLVSISGHTENVLQEMRDADLFVVPSLFDSYPDTIIEAIHCGTAVIASRVGGIPDMLGSGDLLFEPADAGQIYRKIRSLMENPEEFRRLRDLTRARSAYFDFDWAQAWLDAMEHAQT